MTTTEAHTEIMRRLRIRHAEDIADAEVYVPGSSGAGMGSQRMDFFAIACSWASPRVTAYEVKVSRSDFVRDDKWPTYLPCCHQFVFVTAPGVCTIGEIPEEAGWQELSANGKSLLTRKKAPRRKIDERAETMVYKHLLMRHFRKGVLPRDQWSDWLKEKRADRKLGHLVSREIKLTLKERVDAVDKENRRLTKAMESYDVVIRAIEALGLDPERIATGMGLWNLDQTLRDRVEHGQTSDVLRDAAALATKMSSTAELLKTQSAALLALREKVQTELQKLTENNASAA